MEYVQTELTQQIQSTMEGEDAQSSEVGFDADYFSDVVGVELYELANKFILD